jgi:hypothetical protein
LNRDIIPATALSSPPLDRWGAVPHGEVINNRDVVTFHGQSVNERCQAFASAVAENMLSHAILLRQRASSPGIHAVEEHGLIDQGQLGGGRHRPAHLVGGGKAGDEGFFLLDVERRNVEAGDGRGRQIVVRL